LLKRIGLYITLFWSITSQAQYISIGGDFSIDNQRGCRDMFVTVTNTVPPPDSVVVIFLYEGRNSPPTSDTTFLYTSTGNFWLYRFIQNDSNRVDSMLVEVLDPIIPDFELHSCNNNDLEVEIMNSAYDIYEIDYGDGTVIQVPVNTFPPIHSYLSSLPVTVTVTGLYNTSVNRCGTNSITFTPVNQVQPAQINVLSVLDNQSLVIQYVAAPNTITSLEVSLNNTGNFQLFKNLVQGTSADTLLNLQLPITTYCFRVVSHDACSNFKVYSNELCSVYLAGQAVNNSIDLSWGTVFPVNHLSTDIIGNGSNIVSLTNQELNYSDTSIVCKTEYCYYLEIRHSDGSISISNQQVCETAFSTDTPLPIDDISVNIIGDEIRWTWPIPTNTQIQYYEIFSETGQFIDSTSVNTLSTSFPDDTGVCIKMQITDICDNISELSSIVCPLLVDRIINGDGSITLNWSDFTGWQNGVNNYSVVIFDLNMNMLDSISVGSTTQYNDPLPTDDNQVSFYRIWATAIDTGLEPSSSNLIMVERQPVIVAPSSFTPNGDNLNDVFEITGKYIKSVNLSILNRWGSTIYQVNGNSWDGTSNGKQVPLGNYVYHIIVKDFIDNEHIRTGTVLILKN
jgi:gliding motility-associated-like protein